MSRTLTTLLAVALIAAVGVAWYRVVSDVPPPTVAPPADPGPVPVRVEVLAAGPVKLEVEAYGTLPAARRLVLALEVGGRVAQLHPDWRPGGAVAAGELLVALDPQPFELEVAAARAALEETSARRLVAAAELTRAEQALGVAREQVLIAERERDRADELFQQGSVTESYLDQSRLSLLTAELLERNAAGALESGRASETAALAAGNRAQASLDQAQDRRERASLTSPFDGHFADRGPVVGDLVAAGTPLGELVDTGTLHLSLRVFEDDLPGLRPGLEARVSLPARTTLELAGRVRAVAPVVDPATRSAAVEVEVSNDGPAPLPAGQFAQAVVAVGRLEKALVIDRRQFLWRGEQAVAFVLREGDGPPRAELRELELGRAVGEGFVVEAGLAEGETLIVEPLDRLRGGAEVQVLGERAVELHERDDGGERAASPALGGWGSEQ